MPILRIIFVLLAITPIAAIAHSPIAYVLPQDGAVINKSPETLEIVFTGPSKLIKVSLQKFAPEANKSLLGSLLGAGEGVNIALDGEFLMQEGKRHLISIPSLEEGNYQTSWRAISEDGHTIKGESSFIISPDGVDYVARQDELLEGEGQIKRIRGSKVTIKHGPIGDLMPAMTMESLLPDGSLLEGLKRGDKVFFKLNSDLEITEIKGK